MIAIIQSKEELSFVAKRYPKIPTILALNLEVATYCKVNNIEFKFPFENKEYYELSKEILVDSKNFLDSINFKVIKYNFLINEIKAILRYKFNQTVFLIEVVNHIKSEYKKIVYTDYFSNSKLWFDKNFINIDDALNVLNLNNLEKLKCKKNLYTQDKQNLYEYEMVGIKHKKEKKIIFNNAGYNLKKIIKYFFFNKYKIAIPKKNLSFIKRFIFNLIGFELYDFKKTNIPASYDVPDLKINFSYKNYDLSEILKNEFISHKQYLGNLVQKYNAIIKYLSLSNVKLTICNANREMGSVLLEASSNKGVKSILVSHGTITKSYDQFDKIYKDYIAEGVFLGKSDIKAIQSKICKKSLETLKVEGSVIETGNLLFSENIKNNADNKKIITYAVTNKRLPALQIHGVEYFFEFYRNLEILNKLAQTDNFKIIVHLHPGIKKIKSNFEKIFQHLLIKTGDISSSLKKSFLTISYSSTVIEDSLYNKVPVVLLDLHKKRYVHFESETNPEKLNKALYYIDNVNDLKKCIKSVRQSQIRNFDDYIYDSSTKKNINNFFKNYIK